MNKKANDNSAMADMAGLNNQDEHTVDIMKQKMMTFGAQVFQNEERILRDTCPVNLMDPENKVRVVGTVDGAGIKTYSIDDTDFVRIHPPVIENEYVDGQHKILATTKWEKLQS